jgi:predicted RNase H-like HicB family nuclease
MTSWRPWTPSALWTAIPVPDLRYPVLIEPVYVDGRIVEYSATPPDLPGCVGVGRTPESALRDIRVEIERWLMDCANRGLYVSSAPPTTKTDRRLADA